MLELQSSWFTNNSQTGGIQEAVNQTLGVARIIIESALKPVTTVKIKAPGRLILNFQQAALDFSGDTALGSVGFQFQSPVDILAWQSSISNTQASPLMFLAGSEGSTINGLEIFGGNLGNNQGHASGVFCYNVPGITYCSKTYVHHGNGNGFRGGSLVLKECHVNATALSSATHSGEGIVIGSNSVVEDCLIENAWAAGILAYCAENYQHIRITGNRIRNSSLWSGVDPAIGNNPAIGLAANDFSISDVIIAGNSVWDDQQVPTTSHLLSVKANAAGSIRCGRVFGNTQMGCVNPNQVYTGLLESQLIDWQVL